MDPQTQWAEISILFTDNPGIQALKKAYFNLDEVTDVISVRYERLPGETGYTGEIIVNVQRALEVGPSHQSADHELALYLAHGCDHLCGEDDSTPEEKRRMRARETRWLKAADQQELLNGLIK